MGLGVQEVVSRRKSLAKEVGITLHKKECLALLQWMLRKQCAESPTDCLQKVVLEKAGQELWEGASAGNKEALGLIPVLGTVRSVIQKDERHLNATARQVLLGTPDDTETAKTDGEQGREQSEGEENKTGESGEEMGTEAPLLAPLGAPRQGQATPGVQISDDGQFWSMNPKGTLTCFPRAPVPSAPWPVQAGTPAFTVAPPPYGAAPRGAAAPGVGEGRMPGSSPVEQPLPSTSRRVTSSKDRVEGSQRCGADDETSSSGEEEGHLCIDLLSEGERRRRGRARDQVRRAGERWVIRAQECMLSGCELEPMPRSCYPVFVGGPQGPPWQPVDYKMLMQLRKAVQEGGLTGSQAQVPIFEAYIQEEVDSLRARAQADPAHPLHNIPADAIAGKGNWSTPQEQLILPATVLVAAADLGR
ncbi:uncharacterized protein LOC110402877 [Numida meleagris]|uniref:uncharacterized protein LOC110402877 n=1 Tax=Numida meleagris TaxID=8996 RepID=UPI000B3E30F0|nr:uncharacterized protein LOC110402877 [Numida meleagris]